MKAILRYLAGTAAVLLLAMPAHAQDGRTDAVTLNRPAAVPSAAGVPAADTAAAAPTEDAEDADDAAATAPVVRMQYYKPQDQRGINIFEAPKVAGAPYSGFLLDWSAAFTQQFQALDHSNAAEENIQNGVDANELMPIGAGFNTAAANLSLNAQLAPGIRVALTTYLSSRHHPEAWVKDGYLLVDESPIDVPLLHDVMDYVTLKAGHFEINYGDAHYRRSDNGNALFNPFVGNYVLDAFTTEIGAEVYVRANGALVMAGITGGEIKGNVTRPDDRNFAYIGKLGFDRALSEDLRFRLTGSMYRTEGSINNTLYGGDRAGSRYYFVMEPVGATESANFTSGLINPGFRNEIAAYQINPFVEYRGLELFGVVEAAKGRAGSETTRREWTQYAVDVVYRFMPGDRAFMGARYNTAAGELAGIAGEVGVDRIQLGGGWFITPNLLVKGEYVTQAYNDFPTTDIRHDGAFDGFVVEGVVAF